MRELGDQWVETAKSLQRRELFVFSRNVNVEAASRACNKSRCSGHRAVVAEERFVTAVP